MIAIVAIAANLPYLLRSFDPNPINQVSGLGSTTSKGLLPGLDSIDPNNGYNSQALGHRAALDWWHGVVPWWNHYAGVGSPLAGDMQSAALLPLTLLLGWSSGQVAFHLILELISGLAAYFLLRRLSVQRWAAFAGGVAFCLNGTFAWFGHAAANPVAFLPVLLLGIENARTATVEDRRWGWALIAVGLALSIYAGFPETAYIDGLLAALWVLVRSTELGWAEAARFIGKVTAGLLVGILLAAPLLVAFADYLSDGFTGTHNGVIGHAYLVPGALPMTALPYVYGPIFAFAGYDRLPTLGVAWGNVGGYVTSVLMLLAAIGVMGRRHRLLRLVLGAWTAIALGRSFGVPLALNMVNAVPQMVNIAFFRYSPVSWELAIVVLASLGLSDIITGEASRIRVAACAVVALLTIGWLGHASLPLLHELVGAPHRRAWAVGSVVWAAGVIVAGAAVALVTRQSTRGALLAGLVLADVLLMFVIPEFSAPRQAALDTKPVAFLQSHLGSGRFYTLGPLAPNYGSYFGLASVAETDLPLPKRWTNYVTKNLDTNADPVNFNGETRRDPAGPSAAAEFARNIDNFREIGVKYLLLPPHAAVPVLAAGPGLPTVFADDHVRIVELPNPRPFVEDPSGRCQVTVINLQKMRASCPTPSTLMRRELYMAGWRASVNGRSVPLRPQGELFQSVALPAGMSTVEFAFEPPHMTLGVICLLVALAAVGMPFVVDRLRPPSSLTHPAASGHDGGDARVDGPEERDARGHRQIG